MKVLLIHQAFVGPNESGGTRHYELGKYFVEQGHELEIITSQINYSTGKKHPNSAEELEPGIKIKRSYTYTALHKSFIWRVWCFITFMMSSLYEGLKAENVDVVMGTSPPLFQAISAWLVSVFKRCPFVLEVRDLWPDFAVDMGVLTNPILIKLAKWVELFLYKRARKIIVNSPAYKDYLIKNNVDASKIDFIPNGVDLTMFDNKGDGEGVRKKYNLENKIVVTYTGALGMANDIGCILNAASFLQDQNNIYFLIIGDGKEKGNLEKQAKELRLNNISFLGALPKSTMPDILAATDICIATLQDIPMFSMTYPNKVFDYMAAGKPTILAIDGVIRKVIEKSNGGLFSQPGSSQQLGENILSLATDKSRREQMGKNAQEYVKSNFNRLDQAKLFCELMANINSRVGDEQVI